MRWLITGGAGFIGCNAAAKLLKENHDVILLDNFSRQGTRENLAWLKRQGNIEVIEGDIRDTNVLKNLFSYYRNIDAALHLAAQVAVTTSVLNPREDFEINLLGSFNLCEAIRHYSPKTILLYASTNKVYGKMEDLQTIKKNQRYTYKDFPLGIPETHPLDFHSPYGCSKGGAEQYIRDYSRIYRLRTVSFRQSCIYGTRQFGIEDQGWVAWFMIAAITGKPLTIYGDGKQVRDILWVDDLVDCYQKAVRSIEKTSGQIYNIGGGPDNTLSLLELVAFMERKLNRTLPIPFADWRPGDQPVYISAIEKARSDFGWSPKTDKTQGLEELWNWVEAEKALFEKPPLVHR